MPIKRGFGNLQFTPKTLVATLNFFNSIIEHIDLLAHHVEPVKQLLHGHGRFHCSMPIVFDAAMQDRGIRRGNLVVAHAHQIVNRGFKDSKIAI